MKNSFRNFQFTPSVIALIAMNLIPLIGVLYFGWNAGTIVFLYWLENVVIGILNVPKIFSCQGGFAKALQGRESGPFAMGGRAFLSVFFSFHYGLFCFGHYAFLQSTYDDLPGFGEMIAALTGPVLFWSLLGLTLSHIISMLVNFYGKGEYKTRSSHAQMFLPYSRIVVLHIVIIFGGFLAVATGEGLAALILLVALKIVFDLAAHTVEHSKINSLIAPKID